MSRSHFLQLLLRPGAGQPALRNTRSGVLVATRVETAFESTDRRKGLLGRDGFAPGQAMVIAPTNLVHTFAMRFAIDILFVARDGRVLKVSSNVPPRRIAGSLRGFAVVELPAGQAGASDTRVGDSIEVVAA